MTIGLGFIARYRYVRVLKMAFCLMLDYGTGLSWIDEVGDLEYPAMLEDGGGFMFRLSPDLDAYSRQVLLQSLQTAISAEMNSPGSQHENIRAACESAEYLIRQA